MPVILDISTDEQSRICVWQVSEHVEFFRRQLLLSETEERLVSDLGPIKQREWLASRYALDLIVDHDERVETASLPTGKPYLIGRPEQISLSHSGDCVAAMTGMTDVGIDIQIHKEKILGLEHKFATDAESSIIDRSDTLLHLHILWCAKEVLYKIYGRKQLSFRTHLHVDLPKAVEEINTFSGEIRIDGHITRCSLHSTLFNNYVLVYGQKHPG